MQERAHLRRESQIVMIGVNTPKPVNIHIRVSDAAQVNTLLTDRYNVVNGNQYFYVRMPMAPNVALIEVFNEKNGLLKDDPTFSMIKEGIWRMPLERKTAVIDIRDSDVQSFLSLAQPFCYNAGHLAPGDYKRGSICLRYLPKLLSDSGQELNTPAQTGEIDGIIEISQNWFQKATVPERFAILCHEFAHYFLNTNMYSEVEADLQGLNIYLALGYPRYDAYNAFLETFKGAKTELNDRRLVILRRFIDDFENNKFLELYEKRA